MTDAGDRDRDPVLARLAALPVAAPDAELSRRIRQAAHATLRPRRLHLLWALAVGASSAIYLAWAMYFTSRLY